MQTPWKIICGYTLGPATNAQAVYEELFKAALSYKYRGIPRVAVPVNGRELTDAIFTLNSHDVLRAGNKQINGQQLKELFITTLFLKRLETQFQEGNFFFLVLPVEEESCDTAVIVANADAKLHVVNGTQVRIPKEHVPFEFQIKEYINYQKSQNLALLVPERVDISKLKKIAGQYTENVLIFMRAFSNYHSEDTKDFFKEHPNCYLISIPDAIMIIPQNSTEEQYQPIQLNKEKHNYIITYPEQTFSVISFDPPRYLKKLNI